MYGVISKTAYILTETRAHLTADQAAVVQSVGGAAVLLGYAFASSMSAVLLSAIGLGFATGGEGRVLPYMTIKYFGAQAFGKIYGMLGALFAAGTGLSPVTCAGMYSVWREPKVPLVILAVAAGTVSLAFLWVGRRVPG